VASGRRLIVLVVALALVGAPAVVLTAFCVGESCAQEEGVTAAVPFCPLPADIRAQIEAGFRQGRSPDVMAATSGTDMVTNVDGVPVSWPSTSVNDDRVPIAMWGAGVNDVLVPDGTGLDQIAPTLESILGFARPHPQVRAGVAVDGVASGSRPRLIVMIAMRGVGSTGLEATPATRRFARELLAHSAGTLDGSTGSLPLDPVASLTTIGTGALPSQHGITASFVRNTKSDVTPAWGDGAPLSVVSTLAEDLDRHFGERSSIGFVARDGSDRGLIGGSWYPEHDRDDIRVGAEPLVSVDSMLKQGFGTDDIPDIIAVALAGRTAKMIRTTAAIGSLVRQTHIPATFVLAGTGQASADSATNSIERDVDAAIGARVVSATVAGGLFLDQAVMAANDVTSDDVVRALDAMKAPDGTPLFADAYPGFAISFSRYC
jgi:hypothetical protein